MEIPNNIKIGAMNYKVLIIPEAVYLNGKECYGTINTEKNVIQINSLGKSKQKVEQIFWHEVLHGILNEKYMCLGENEEQIVTELGIALHQFISDNNFHIV